MIISFVGYIKTTGDTSKKFVLKFDSGRIKFMRLDYYA